MSINDAGRIFLISAVDGFAGVITGSLVEAVSPPITTQSTPRLIAEGLIQVGALTYLGIEVARVINRTQRDPTNGLPFTWGLLFGAPNTITKLGMIGQQLRNYASSIISQPSPQEQAEVPTQ